jgi:hypothetical protein
MKHNAEGISPRTVTNEDKSAAAIDHPLLNKWLTAEIINNLPDETAQAVADLIKAAVRREKPAVNGIYYGEFHDTGQLVSFNRDRLRDALLNWEGVKDVSEKQPEQQGDK